MIGAYPHQRTETRTGQRNGHRLADGHDGCREPRVAHVGSFFPSLLERRRRVDQSLFAVIMEAYLHGTSTRKVDEPGQGAQRRPRDLQVRGIPDLADLDTEGPRSGPQPG